MSHTHIKKLHTIQSFLDIMPIWFGNPKLVLSLLLFILSLLKSALYKGYVLCVASKYLQRLYSLLQLETSKQVNKSFFYMTIFHSLLYIIVSLKNHVLCGKCIGGQSILFYEYIKNLLEFVHVEVFFNFCYLYFSIYKINLHIL